MTCAPRSMDMDVEAGGAAFVSSAPGKPNRRWVKAGGGGGGGKGSWVCLKNVDMCGQGDVDGVGDWRAEGKSVEELRRMAEARGHMAFSIDPSGRHFKHCAFKRFDFQLTPAHCTPSPGYTNEIHIFTPAGSAAQVEGWFRLVPQPEAVVTTPETYVCHSSASTMIDIGDCSICLSMLGSSLGADEIM